MYLYLAERNLLENLNVHELIILKLLDNTSPVFYSNILFIRVFLWYWKFNAEYYAEHVHILMMYHCILKILFSLEKKL